MPQFDFLGSERDATQILYSISLPRDATIYLDKDYDSSVAPPICSLHDIDINNMLNERSLYVCLKPYSIYEPQLFQIKTGANAGKFAIDECAGGPLYSLILPASFQEHGKINISCGILSPPPHWLNPLTNVLEKPSTRTVAGYKELVRRIKKVVVVHTFHKRIWAGPDAIQQIESGMAEIRGFGLD